MLQSTPDRWLVGGRKESAAPMRLFAFPYAGGGASIFRQWHKSMPPNLDLFAVQLPGRETRFTEPKLTYFATAMETVVTALRPHLNQPFAFFGHSLGALLAFESARCLRRMGGPAPVHLFLSGCSAPQVHDPIPGYNRLSDAEFIKLVTRYGGMAEELLANQELMDMFLPTLRADFSLLETYKYFEETPLDCPISVFGGLDDIETPRAKLASWNIHTSKTFRINMYPGNHFYLNHVHTALIEEIIRELDRT